MQGYQKEGRLDFRLSIEQKELIENAAHINGQTLSSFALEILLKKAKKIIREHQQTILSIADSKKFIEILEKNEEPNGALKSAFDRYRKNNNG